MLRRFVQLALLIGAVPALMAQAQRPEVVFEPTPHETVERMLALAEVGPNDVVIDLGSGDGRIPIAAAGRGARAVGIELDAGLLQESRAKAQAAGVASRVSFRQEDLFATDLSQASVVTLYLHPEMNVRLIPRLLALKPGTRIVAHRFGIGDWKPDRTESEGAYVMLWTVPARAAGSWQMRFGERQVALELEQRYQELSGHALIDGNRVALREPRLDGSAIAFTLELGASSMRFQGTVAGDSIQGSTGGLTLGVAQTSWQATRVTKPAPPSTPRR